MFGMYVVGQNGRVLTAKYRKNAEKSALYSSWWGRIAQALTIYRKDSRARLLEYYKKEAPAVGAYCPVQELHYFNFIKLKI